MVARLGMAAVLLLGIGIGVATVSAAAEPRMALNREDVLEVGEPMLVSRDVLKREMKRNSEMRRYIERYGWPDFAEVQEVVAEDPYAAYEVRLYYVHRNQVLMFAPVYMSKGLDDFGIRKYEGSIPPDSLARLMASVRVAAPPLAPAVLRHAETPAAEPPVEPELRAMDEVAPQMTDLEPVVGLEARLAQMEAAADRAALAAEMADRASQTAQASAQRAVSIVGETAQ